MDFNIVKKDSSPIIGQLTKDQEIAYKNLIEFIKAPYNQKDYKRALCGAAGTGKTYLVKAIIRNCGLSYSTIGLSAPTHKACRVLSESIQLPNIKVNTLQSDLGLKLNFNVEKFDIRNPPFDPRGRIKIGEYKLYIVDEASMINKGLCKFLEKTCVSNQCKIIYIGDDYQLSPVGENYSTAFKSTKCYYLREIVRQEEDNPIRHLLDLLRFDIEHRTFRFLEYITAHRNEFDSNEIKGYKVCTSNEFNSLMYNNFNDPELTKNVDFTKIIAYTNAVVSNWNKVIRNAIIEKADTSIITNNDLIISYTTLVNVFNECIITNSEDYIIKDVVNYTHPKYAIKGFMVRFQAIHGGKVSSPLFVVDHKDPNSVRMYLNLSEKFIDIAKKATAKTRAQAWKDYYNFKEGCLLLANIVKSDGTILYGRDLDYGFALTSHKSQGSTFDTVFVDVNDIVYDRNEQPYTDAEQINRRLYVACSRAKYKLYLKFGN